MLQQLFSFIPIQLLTTYNFSHCTSVSLPYLANSTETHQWFRSFLSSIGHQAIFQTASRHSLAEQRCSNRDACDDVHHAKRYTTSGMPAPVIGKLATWQRVPQWRVALLVGVGFALGAVPVYMHSRKEEGVQNPYHEAKLRQRAERFAWYESDEMPSK